jgi:hypothetical protein
LYRTGWHGSALLVPGEKLASDVHLVRRVDLINSRQIIVAATIAAGAAMLAGCTSTSTSATAPSSTKCQVSATAAPAQFAATGGSGTVDIRAARDCTWSVAAQASWVAIKGAQSGNGDASIAYSVSSNPVPSARSAELIVEQQHLQVTQAGAPCTYALSRTSDNVTAEGGTLAIELSTLTGCAWSATSSASWLTLSGPTSGSTSSELQMNVAPNTATARTGTVTAGGRTYTVMQAAAAAVPGSPSPDPTPAPDPTPTPGPDPTPTPPPAPSPVSLSGTIGPVSGSCPNVEFPLSGRTVVADRDTDVKGGRCRNLSKDDQVTVSGVLRLDGTVLAETIVIDKDEK